MSVTYIPERTKFILWGKSTGRCQYCNHPIYLDEFTKTEFNTAYIAHIVADKPDGPRGSLTDSERLKSDISNLMLMCDTHHRLIDREDVEGHPVELLRQMKAEHEARVSVQTEAKDRQSNVLLYGAKIGLHDSPLTWTHAHEAMGPERYPADKTAIQIGLKNSAFGDDEESYWKSERANLNRNFNRLVRQPVADGYIKHLSVFALAPQPLLIELGRLISDMRPTDVYQLQREPTTWRWQNNEDDIKFIFEPPSKKRQNVALNISLSATVDNDRVLTVLGEDTSIWTLTLPTPQNDFMKSPKTLASFRQIVRKVFEKIKSEHGQDAILKVFPAMPISAAIEFGRVWQPKADMEMVIYDQNRNRGGFVETITIQNKDFS